MSLSKNINPSLVLVQPRKTRPFITERLLMGYKESNQANKRKDHGYKMLLQLPFIKTKETLYKNVNENMFSFTFLCRSSCICNFDILVRIFMKFSPKCRTKKLGMIYTILECFCLYFLIGKETIFGPKSGLGKSLQISYYINDLLSFEGLLIA